MSSQGAEAFLPAGSFERDGLPGALAQLQLRARLGELAPTAFLFKPFDGVSLLRTVEEAFRATRRG